MTLVRVSATHFVAGLLLNGRLVVKAAPILRWSVGQSWGRVQVYFRGKGWSWEVVP